MIAPRTIAPDPARVAELLARVAILAADGRGNARAHASALADLSPDGARYLSGHVVAPLLLAQQVLEELAELLDVDLLGAVLEAERAMRADDAEADAVAQELLEGCELTLTWLEPAPELDLRTRGGGA